MEDFKKFSLLKDVQTITSDGTPSMDKQDKTAERKSIINFLLGADEYNGVWFGEDNPYKDGKFWWRTPLREHVAELEAKIKALEERLEAADEVIAYTEKINFYATHGDVKREYDEALAKYQSLKQ